MKKPANQLKPGDIYKDNRAGVWMEITSVETHKQKNGKQMVIVRSYYDAKRFPNRQKIASQKWRSDFRYSTNVEII